MGDFGARAERVMLDVPRTHGDGIEASLTDRVKWLVLTVKFLNSLPDRRKPGFFAKLWGAKR